MVVELLQFDAYCKDCWHFAEEGVAAVLCTDTALFDRWRAYLEQQLQHLIDNTIIGGSGLWRRAYPEVLDETEVLW